VHSIGGTVNPRRHSAQPVSPALFLACRIMSPSAATVARAPFSGHFWQGRSGAVRVDEAHLAAALRYVSLNPVRARLAGNARPVRALLFRHARPCAGHPRLYAVAS
jgi:hypothetical protein